VAHDLKPFYCLDVLKVTHVRSGRPAASCWNQIACLATVRTLDTDHQGDQQYSERITRLHYERSITLVVKDSAAGVRALHACLSAGVQIGEQLPRTVEVLSLLAQAYETRRETQRAYDALRSATRLDPRNEAPYLDLMSLSLEHHTWDLALEISEVALSHLPGSWRVRLQRGAVLALKGDVAAAESDFVQAAGMAPRSRRLPGTPFTSKIVRGTMFHMGTAF
jgi:tetratricopeptide (TPR) repeat protein